MNSEKLIKETEELRKAWYELAEAIRREFKLKEIAEWFNKNRMPPASS
jgi:hypothetical protein